MGTIFSNSGNCIAVKRWQFVPEDCTNVKNYELTQTGDVWVFLPEEERGRIKKP
jgi:hypothetical protein